jgi:hypothetical protein
MLDQRTCETMLQTLHQLMNSKRILKKTYIQVLLRWLHSHSRLKAKQQQILHFEDKQNYPIYKNYQLKYACKLIVILNDILRHNLMHHQFSDQTISNIGN